MYRFIFIYLSIRGEPFMDLDHVKVFCVWIPPPYVSKNTTVNIQILIYTNAVHVCAVCFQLTGGKKEKKRKKKKPCQKTPQILANALKRNK